MRENILSNKRPKIKFTDTGGRIEPLSYMPFYDDGKIQIWNDKFEGVLPQLKKIDIIITDPPYPDYYVDEYKYYDGILNFLAAYECKQLIFWSARTEFPLTFTGKHVWDKVNGTGTQYEYLYERNGTTAYKYFRDISPSNRVRAQIGRDKDYGHPSQKPLNLLLKLIDEYTKEDDVILDTFMGSGTTIAAAKILGRRAIGIEMQTKWCEVAVKRLNQFELFG